MSETHIQKRTAETKKEEEIGLPKKKTHRVQEEEENKAEESKRGYQGAKTLQRERERDVKRERKESGGRKEEVDSSTKHHLSLLTRSQYDSGRLLARPQAASRSRGNHQVLQSKEKYRPGLGPQAWRRLRYNMINSRLSTALDTQKTHRAAE